MLHPLADTQAMELPVLQIFASEETHSCNFTTQSRAFARMMKRVRKAPPLCLYKLPEKQPVAVTESGSWAMIDSRRLYSRKSRNIKRDRYNSRYRKTKLSLA
ncbi:hypothetical protein PoB_003577400 [Plakobranchus ocellatus]|uniref:Uncharacterized protein n=1 Tax=Plakobranchus ocellatus TaxID=259542 RepID=A0AAV4AT18_9GAST|nr:hypothetical protein PoB_003577400 [Plakobranchus ocellatus]